MALTIKNAEADRLARALAQLTKTITTPSRFISERYSIFIFVPSPARRGTVNSSLILRPSARDCIAEVLSIGGTPTTNQACLLVDRFGVVECDASVVAF